MPSIWWLIVFSCHTNFLLPWQFQFELIMCPNTIFCFNVTSWKNSQDIFASHAKQVVWMGINPGHSPILGQFYTCCLMPQSHTGDDYLKIGWRIIFAAIRQQISCILTKVVQQFLLVLFVLLNSYPLNWSSNEIWSRSNFSVRIGTIFQSWKTRYCSQDICRNFVQMFLLVFCYL